MCSNLGWVIFGPSSELFATWTNSFVTMTRVALGEFDSVYPGMYTINPESAFIIIATYQVGFKGKYVHDYVRRRDFNRDGGDV